MIVSQKTLQTISRESKGGQPMTNCYLSLGGPDRSPGRLAEVTHQLVRQARERLGNEDWSPHERASLSSDLDNITRYVGTQFQAGSGRGLAILSCAESGVWNVITTEAPLPNRLTQSERPYLGPLALLAARHPRTAVIMVDREKARLMLLESGTVTEMDPITDDVPRRVHPGSYYGLSDRNIERHVDEHIHQHLKHVANAAMLIVQAEQTTMVVIAGQPESMAELLRLLPQSASGNAILLNGLPMTASQSEVLDRVYEATEEARLTLSTALVHQIEDEAHPGGHAVEGMTDTLRSLFRGSVNTLAVSESATAPGLRCSSCGRLMAVRDTCPECGGAGLRKVVDLVEEAIGVALREGARVVFLPASAKTVEKDWDGLSALLRFPLPEVLDSERTSSVAA